MPLSLASKLDLIQTDPLGLNYRTGPEAADQYLHLRLAQDYDRYLEVKRDSHANAKLSDRYQLVLSRRVLAEGIEEDAKNLEYRDGFSTILQAIQYEGLCETLMDTGNLIGFSVLKLDWDVDPDTNLVLPTWEHVPQRRFTFQFHQPDNRSIPVCTGEDLDPTTEIKLVYGYELRLLTQREPLTGERCPRDRFLVYTFGTKSTPWGLGLGYNLYPWTRVKDVAREAWMLHSDRVGSPPILGTYDPKMIDENKPADKAILTKFETWLATVAPQSWVRMPNVFAAKLMEMVGSAGPQVHESLIALADAQMSKAVLHEQNVSELTHGSRAAGEAQTENRQSTIVDSDANNVDEQLYAQLWIPFFNLNLPDGLERPIIRRESWADIRKQQAEQAEKEAEQTEVSTLETRVKVEKEMRGLGYKPTEKYIKRVYGEDWELAEVEPTVLQVPGQTIDAEAVEVTDPEQLTGDPSDIKALPAGQDKSGASLQAETDAIIQAIELAEAIASELIEFKAPGKYSHINFTPPQGVRDAARRGLELRRQHGRGGLTPQEAGKQGIGSGVSRASALMHGRTISPKVIRMMVGFFARHQKNAIAPKAGEAPSNGWIAWLLWGGNAGRAWANKVWRQIQAADAACDHTEYAAPKVPTKYTRGLSQADATRRKAEIRRRIRQGSAGRYDSLPGDDKAKTRPSSHTQKAQKKYGKGLSLGQLAEKSGISLSTLKTVYQRGLRAWQTGHRPGASQHAWAMARVYSFTTGGKTRRTADKDLWERHLKANHDEAIAYDLIEYGAIIDRILRWNKLDIGVEYLPGQVRFPGRKHSKKLRSGYGHIRRVKGSDGEAMDVYIYPGLLKAEPEGTTKLFRVKQIRPATGEFDEEKVMIGYADLEAARAAYLREMPEEFFGGIQAISLQRLIEEAGASLERAFSDHELSLDCLLTLEVIEEDESEEFAEAIAVYEAAIAEHTGNVSGSPLIDFKQQHTSAGTSINSGSPPAVFGLVDRHYEWEEGTINLDMGGGKYDTGTQALNERDVANVIIDPFNKPDDHNAKAAKFLQDRGGADSATISNVLNVVRESDERQAILQRVKKLVKSGAPIYITIYEGDESGKGSGKGDNWQENRELDSYLAEVQRVFPGADISHGMIVAQNGKANSESEEDDSDNDDDDDDTKDTNDHAEAIARQILADLRRADSLTEVAWLREDDLCLTA